MIKQLSRRKLDKWDLIPLAFTLAGFLLVFSGIHTNQVRQRQQKEQLELISLNNQNYLKVMTCIASADLQARTPQYIKSCYDLAEQETGTKIIRYGHGKN